VPDSGIAKSKHADAAPGRWRSLLSQATTESDLVKYARQRWHVWRGTNAEGRHHARAWWFQNGRIEAAVAQITAIVTCVR